MKAKTLLFLVLTLASGCGSDALTTPDPTAVTEDDSQAADDAAGKADGMCIHRHQTCKPGGQRCCTGFCSSSGYYGYGYGQGTCSAFLVDGSYCQDAHECKSKVCTDYVCVPACIDAAKACTASADCCSGFCRIGYITGTCAPAQENGAYCQADSECVSKHCAEYVCAD